MMEKGRIAIAALEPHTSSLAYQLDEDKEKGWCKHYNEGLREFVRRHPDRFVALVAFPLQDPGLAATMLEHAIRELKLSGRDIASNVNGRYYDSNDFDPFWGMAQKLDALVVMHPEDVADSDRMGPYDL